jgi:hypothetical protein
MTAVSQRAGASIQNTYLCPLTCEEIHCTARAVGGKRALGSAASDARHGRPRRQVRSVPIIIALGAGRGRLLSVHKPRLELVPALPAHLSTHTSAAPRGRSAHQAQARLAFQCFSAALRVPACPASSWRPMHAALPAPALARRHMAATTTPANFQPSLRGHVPCVGAATRCQTARKVCYRVRAAPGRTGARQRARRCLCSGWGAGGGPGAAAWQRAPLG